MQLSRRQLYRLQISAINLRFACAAITLSSFAIGLFLYHCVNNQKLDITNKPQQLSQHQAKLIHSSVVKVNNEAISTIKSTNVLNSQKANSHNIVYNVKKPPILSKDNKKLESIIKELVNLAKKQDLPIDNLSITLIDINQKKISAYQQHIPRYPTSVVKLFWMVALEAQINQGLIANNKYIKSDLEGMILKSDNDAASRILDTLTRTKSSYQSSNKNIDACKSTTAS